MIWTGNILGNNHDQGSNNRKVKLQSGRVPDGARLRVRPMGSTFPEVPTIPNIGDVFTISATDIGKRQLKGVTKFKVAQKAVYQFVTSCKSPLRMNDEFGPFKIIGWTLHKNTTRLASSQCPLVHNADSLIQDSSKQNDNNTVAPAGFTGGIIVMAVMVVVAVAGVVYASTKRQAASGQALQSNLPINSDKILD
jgi:hypothetical protein